MTDRDWLLAAIDLSRRCPVASAAYSVGAIVVDGGGDGGGRELARGYSRETDPQIHAEEAALAKLPAGAGLAEPGPADAGPAGAGLTIYSSLEPCSTRRSRSRSCTELILAAGIRRVVFALREPPLLADCQGAEQLAAAGLDVIELVDLAPLVREINSHLLTP